VEQVLSNIAASDAPPISPEIHDRITGVYDARIRRIVHHLW